MSVGMPECVCGQNWVVWAVEFRTGRPLGQLDIISLEFEDRLMQPGTGTLVTSLRAQSLGSLSFRDLLPGTAALMIQRVGGGSASLSNPITMFGGLVQSLSLAPGGIVNIGFVGLDEYPNHKIMGPNEFGVTADWVYSNYSQTEIAADLINYITGDNLIGSDQEVPELSPPFVGLADPSAINRDRTYYALDFNVVGEVVVNLTQVINGPVYEMEYWQVERIPPLFLPTEDEGNWKFGMRFRDELVVENIPTINESDLENYSLDLDMNEAANIVFATGESSGSTEDVFYTRRQQEAFNLNWPAYEATASWSSVTVANTLVENADGYLAQHNDLAGAFQGVFQGLDFPDIDYLRSGYPVRINVVTEDVIFNTINDNTVIDSVSWRISGDSESITVNVSALNMSDSLFQDPFGTRIDQECEDC